MLESLIIFVEKSLLKEKTTDMIQTFFKPQFYIEILIYNGEILQIYYKHITIVLHLKYNEKKVKKMLKKKEI